MPNNWPEFNDAGEVLSNLTQPERDRLDVLLRGVAHSGQARSEFNVFCHSKGVHPNDLLRLLNPSSLPPSPTEHADGEN